MSFGQSGLPKLVRDKIPSHIEATGSTPIFRRAKADEVEALLYDKLREEVAEFGEAGDLAELADVLAVIERILSVRGETLISLIAQSRTKAELNGGFEEMLVLDRVEIKR